MANTLITSTIVSKMFLSEFVTSNKFINMGSRRLMGDYNNSSGYKLGNSVQIRQRNLASTGDGQVAIVQNIVDSTDTLTINHQYHSLFSISSQEATLSLQSLQEQVIKPAIANLNAKMNYDIIQAALVDVSYAVGDATTQLNSFAKVRSTQAFMNQLMMPTDKRYMGVSEFSGADLESSLSNFFNTKLNSSILFDGYMGRLAGFDFFTDQSITTHIAGTAAQATPGSITVNGAVSSGNTIVMAGAPASAVVFRKGDIITFTNSSTPVNSVTPYERNDTGQIMTFTVAADATSSGGGAVTVTISPSIISDSTNVQRNVTAAIANGAVVGLPYNYEQNLAFSTDAFDIVCPPLQELNVVSSKVLTDPKTNVSIRLSSQGDITNDVNLCRIDVLCGFKWHYKYAVKQLALR